MEVAAASPARQLICIERSDNAQYTGFRGGDDGERSVRQRTGIDGCVLAGRQLPVGWSDLSLRQPAAQANLDQGAHQAAAPRALGNDTRSELHLCSPEPADQE